MAKVIVIVAGLLLAGCASARDIAAFASCAVYQHDANRRCT